MYSCDECAKCFSRIDNLKRHKKIHGVNKQQFKISDVVEPSEDDRSVDGSNDGNDKSNIDIFGDTLDTSKDYEEYGSGNEDPPGQFFTKERSPLDIAMHSVMSNQELDTRNKLKGYFKVVGDHLRCKRFGCLGSKLDIDGKSNHLLKKIPNSHYENISEEEEENCYEDDDSEDDESRIEANVDDSSTEHHESGNGAKRDVFGGTLVNSMECDTSGEESENDDEQEFTDGDSIGDDAGTEPEKSDEDKEEMLEDSDDGINELHENSQKEDRVYEKLIINWPDYNVKKPWQSYSEKIVLFEQLPWLQRNAALQSSLLLMKEIRHAVEPQILALCEIALNLLMDNIPMTVEDFNCYKSQRDSIRELAYGDCDWKRKRLLLGSNHTLVWILLVSIEPLYN